MLWRSLTGSLLVAMSQYTLSAYTEMSNLAAEVEPILNVNHINFFQAETILIRAEFPKTDKDVVRKRN